MPLLFTFVLFIVTLGFCGCSPFGHAQLDEEKEPHFIEGKRRFNAMDYQGSLECFEKALEVNPRSGLAHFEAGLLYEKHKQEHAAAIYHFERFLELRPGSGYAEVVRQHILACKQELAKTVSLGPVTQSMQREFEKLIQENKTLREQVEIWRAAAQSNAAPSAAVATTPKPVQSPPQNVSPALTPAAIAPISSSTHQTASSSSGRPHIVKSGDTPSAIARKYGVRVESLLAANPRLDARHLQVGQNVTVPIQ